MIQKASLWGLLFTVLIQQATIAIPDVTLVLICLIFCTALFLLVRNQDKQREAERQEREQVRQQYMTTEREERERARVQYQENIERLFEIMATTNKETNEVVIRSANEQTEKLIALSAKIHSLMEIFTRIYVARGGVLDQMKEQQERSF